MLGLFAAEGIITLVVSAFITVVLTESALWAHEAYLQRR